MYDSIEKDLLLDPFNLALEASNQPGTFMYWASQYADARKILDDKKKILDITRSEIIMHVKEHPKEYVSDGKATAQIIEAIISRSKNYLTILDELNKAQHEYNILANAVKAFEQKKASIEMLVKLRGHEYFSEPQGHFDTINKQLERGRKKQPLNEKIKAAVKKKKAANN